MSYIDEQKSSNPLLNTKMFQGSFASNQELMTLDGTINKLGFSFIFLLISACYGWFNFNPGLIVVGAIGGFITAMVTVFKKTWSPYTVPVYAILEGLCLGALSFLFEQKYPGIALQAVLLTLLVLSLMLGAYRSNLIRATPRFRKMVIFATGAICLMYLLNLVMGLFGSGLSIINSSSPMGIGLSLFIVGIASMNLVLDFDFIEKASKEGLPKYMEWYAAFSLLVTLVWLYIEILRLLAKLRKK